MQRKGQALQEAVGIGGGEGNGAQGTVCLENVGSPPPAGWATFLFPFLPAAPQ